MFPIIYSIDFDMGRHNKKERKSYLKTMKKERKLASNSCDKILEIIIASAEVDHKIENECHWVSEADEQQNNHSLEQNEKTKESFETDPLYLGFVNYNRYKRKLKQLEVKTDALEIKIQLALCPLFLQIKLLNIDLFALNCGESNLGAWCRFTISTMVNLVLSLTDN